MAQLEYIRRVFVKWNASLKDEIEVAQLQKCDIGVILGSAFQRYRKRFFRRAIRAQTSTYAGNMD